MISANSRVFDKAEKNVSFIENNAEYYLHYKHMDFMLLDPHFQSISIVIIGHFYFFGHDADNCHIVSLNINL